MTPSTTSLLHKTLLVAFSFLFALDAHTASASASNGAPSDWWTQVQQGIAASEYSVTWQNQTVVPDLEAAWHAPNRAQGFRTYFTESGIRVVPRTETPPPWEWGLVLRGYGRGGTAWPVSAASLSPSGNRIDYRRGAITEWYVNAPRGLEQGFTLAEAPESMGAASSAEGRPTGALPGRGRAIEAHDLVHLDLQMLGNLHPVMSADGQAIDFIVPGGAAGVHFAALRVTDASGRLLPAWMEGFAMSPGSGIRIVVDARDAVYPIAVDPLATSPAWTAAGNQDAALFGFSVATAGDVNGDGYSDVIVGSHGFDGGEVNEGKAYVFFGSPSGLNFGPDWAMEGEQGSASFGRCVATAGDVNGDGYADIVVGAYQYDNGEVDEGRVYAYLGSPSGPGHSTAWTVESNQASSRFGISVATAGDVNGDGYSDVIVGADLYDNGQEDEGVAFVYLGSATGLTPSPAWTAEGSFMGVYMGYSVGTAGDVNGDGYADVIVSADGSSNGQSYEGAAFVWLGSATGLGASGTPGNADWFGESDQFEARFGESVATAGDVNGDGYSDVIVGARYFDAGEPDEGRAFVYLGSASGLASWPAWTAESDQASAYFGRSVATAGDVNGDGYSDVIVGAYYYDGGELDEGRAYVYLGSASGLSPSATWIAEWNESSARFGGSVATAGDVNGDGYADVIVGAWLSDSGQTDEGQAFVYLGSASGPGSSPWVQEGNLAGARFGQSVATAGDVNGDGFSDVIVGANLYDNGQLDEGRAFVFLGSASGLATASVWTAEIDAPGAYFGSAVASAGDVNGDGYSDVIIGAPRYTDGEYGWYEGRAFVYLGSASGLAATPAWTADDDHGYAEFGQSVATAGDVNGDGYSDVIVAEVGRYIYIWSRGKVFVYLGSAAGLAASPVWTKEGEQEYCSFGSSVATAGDVNGDGYSDVIIGAELWDHPTHNGRAFVYMGSPSGLGAEPSFTATSPQWEAYLGNSVATAGDVNGDGYSDIVVGARGYDNPLNEGAAFVWLGSDTGLVYLSSTDDADWAAYGNQGEYENFGYSVATAGDVNGDGYSDIVVGATGYDNPLNEGAAFVWLGSASGLGPTGTPYNADWTATGDQSDANFAWSMATAGDVNGDGFADVILGAPGYDNPEIDEGRAFVYYGNGGAGLSLKPQQRRADDTTPIAQGGRSHTPGQFRLTTLGRTPFGRSNVKLESEVKGRARFLDGTGTSRSAAWLETGAAGAALDELVSGLEPGSYHWRVRLLYDPARTPFAQKSRWFTVPWSGWNEADLSLGAFIGGVVWEDVDGDGIRELGESGMARLTVQLLNSGGAVLQSTFTDNIGGYRFEVAPTASTKVRFNVPTGYVLTLKDQGADDTVDSDADPVTRETDLAVPPHQSFDGTGWSAGMLREGPCFPPDEPVYISGVRLDGNGWAILDFQDPNQPDQVTGYNVYRASSPGAPWPWPKVGSNVRDMDAATPNLQWVDQSGDPGSFYYQVNAYNALCDAEGPR